MSVYRPVSCDLHSRLELAVMHRLTRRVIWREGDQERSALLQFKDVETRAGAEWLIGQASDGEIFRVRLDSLSVWE